MEELLVRTQVFLRLDAAESCCKCAGRSTNPSDDSLSASEFPSSRFRLRRPRVAVENVAVADDAGPADAAEAAAAVETDAAAVAAAVAAVVDDVDLVDADAAEVCSGALGTLAAAAA
eukprot:3550972-Pleurochrysis_carterae.AAC.1